MTVLAALGAVVVIAVAVVVVVIVTRTGEARRDDDTFQASLADFYATPDEPLFVVQSLADQIVLPNTTALLAENACGAAEPALTMAWLGQVSHQDTAMTGGLLAVDWLADRLAGVPAGSTCGDPLPVEPASAGS